LAFDIKFPLSIFVSRRPHETNATYPRHAAQLGASKQIRSLNPRGASLLSNCVYTQPVGWVDPGAGWSRKTPQVAVLFISVYATRRPAERAQPIQPRRFPSPTPFLMAPSPSSRFRNHQNPLADTPRLPRVVPSAAVSGCCLPPPFACERSMLMTARPVTPLLPVMVIGLALVPSNGIGDCRRFLLPLRA